MKTGARVWLGLMGAGAGFAATPPMQLEAEAARLNAARAEVVRQESFRGQQGVALKAGIAAAVDTPGPDADLVFTVQVPRAGRYTVSTHAATDALGAELMRKARTKFESLQLRIQVAAQRPTRRVVFVPWSKPELCVQQAGTFELDAAAQEIRVWLPAGVRLDRIELAPFQPPAVPREAAAYQPPIVPPAAHPRLWVDAGSLALIRANLTHPENRPYWDSVRALAGRPFAAPPATADELPYNTPLEQAALAKAFYHLLQGDHLPGREAVDLMLAYLPRVEFGNLLDITREIGAAIHAGACVYDWCHGLMTAAERATLRRHLMRLADGMECGWPPFRLSIINGHGNEAVINRDLLAMAIALYDEDPLPYRYCAYAVLEQLVPMRRFEYQSPRHNQGVSYGAFRFGWEMHAAWLFRRLAGREVFDANLKTVPQYWLHRRLPDGEMLRDGDGVPAGKYWSYAQTALLCYAYNRDPILKGEFLRQGGLPKNPVLFLLLNDPAIKPEPSLASLPLTLDFGPVLGGMVARTGWRMGADSPDVVAEIKGGGYHFGNHQHADAGALQVYYRGLQIAPLAQYVFYGTPYDLNFAKRSIAQAMVRVVDPGEPMLRHTANDGGSRFLQSNPRTPQQARSDPAFHYGQVLSCSFGPDAHTPDFSYFAVDLRGAYSAKIASYVRRFVFLNLHRADHPAAMILLDDVTSSNAAFGKYWQLTTLQPPEPTAGGVRLWNTRGGVTGRLDVALLQPRAGERTLEVLSGADLHRVGDQVFTPPSPTAPEATGHRLVVSPRQARTHDRFLSVLQPGDAGPLPVEAEEGGPVVILRLADRVIALAPGAAMLEQAFDLTVPDRGQTVQVLLAGLAAGTWRLHPGGAGARDIVIEPRKNTHTFASRGGSYRVAPLALTRTAP